MMPSEKPAAWRVPPVADYEKLGAFYLGRPYDVEAKAPQPGLIAYDSKDLVTHAVCVGMTGSGKTGLCIDLIEEAALDGVPTIAIDPKGDLPNLLPTFPELRQEDFRPWIEEQEAARKGRARRALRPQARRVQRAKEDLAAAEQDLASLEEELRSEIAKL